MQDGVAENFTAGMLAPYLDACGCQTGNRGLSYLDPELLRTAVRLLTTEMTYQLPQQDLTVRLNRIPAIPKSRVVLTHIHPIT